MKSVVSLVSALVLVSLPVRGAWIEIICLMLDRILSAMSLPVRGAWIEIASSGGLQICNQSLPVRGAWIEITSTSLSMSSASVAPRAGSVD